MAGKYLHGALLQFTDSFPLPLPRVILFQYNPETLRHEWKPAKGNATASPWKPYNPLAIRGSPEESFSFKLLLDSNEVIADSAIGTDLAKGSGIQARLAALELLLFPEVVPKSGLLGAVSAAIGLSGGATAPKRAVPAGLLPMVLFVWGPGRILPVRVASLSVTEMLYDALLLNPTHAEAEISLTVLTKEEVAFITGRLGSVAKAASTYSLALRRVLAVANLDNTAESIIGMLPS